MTYNNFAAALLEKRTLRALFCGTSVAAFASFLLACSTADPAATAPPTVGTEAPPAVLSTNSTQTATVGTAFSLDATKSGSAFSDPRAQGLTYTITFTPAVSGLNTNG